MQQKISIVRGTTNTLNITVLDASGNPYNLSGGEAIVFGIKQQRSEDCLVVKRIATGSDGKYAVTLNPNDTLELAPGRYLYDVGLQSGNCYYNVIRPSNFEILENVTAWGDGT